MRLIALWLNPLRLAIARVLQCVASWGFVSTVHRTTRSTCASVICRGAPGRGSSSNPSSRLLTKRARQRPTVPRDAREELGALLLQGVVVALRTAFIGVDRHPGHPRCAT